MSTAAIVSLIVAWLLGLLTPSIVRNIERRYRAKEITRGILLELAGLRYTMAVTGLKLRARSSTLDHKFLEWFGLILQSHERETQQEVRETYKKLTKLPAAQLNASSLGKSIAGHIPRPVPYSLPYIDSQLPQLHLLSADFQQRILALRLKLGLFNGQVEFMNRMLELTFNPPAYHAEQDEHRRQYFSGILHTAVASRGVG